MKTVLINILYLICGIGIGYLLFTLNKCEKVQTTETTIRVDTIIHEVQVTVPQYKTIYVNRTDTLLSVLYDSIISEYCIYLKDTTNVPVNEYQDSIKTDDYRFDYTIHTLGLLLDFKPKFTLYQKQTSQPYKKPNWMLSGAVSNELNWKVGAGYQGWTVEGVFRPKFKELYIGKQITF